MRSVLADTGPLYALVDPDDQHHERAERELSRLSAEGRILVCAFPILMECYTLVLRRLGVRVAQRWWNEISEGVGLVSPGREDYLEAGRRAGRYRDQGITLFDALSAVLAEELEAPIWTFDHHFDAMRAVVWR